MRADSYRLLVDCHRGMHTVSPARTLVSSTPSLTGSKLTDTKLEIAVQIGGDEKGGSDGDQGSPWTVCLLAHVAYNPHRAHASRVTHSRMASAICLPEPPLQKWSAPPISLYSTSFAAAHALHLSTAVN